VITDAAGTVEYVNPSFLDLLGCALEDAVGKDSLKKNHPSRFLDIFGALAETVTAEGKASGEQRNRRMNGELYWENITVSPIRNGENIITHYVAVKEDITARKNAETALRKSRADLIVQHEQQKALFNLVEAAKNQWESTMDCIGDIVIVADFEGRIRRCNKALKDLTGNSYDEMSGRIWQELFSEHGLPVPLKCVSGTELFHEPSERWFVFNSYPFRDRSRDEISGVVITLHDTTEVKRFTRELEKAYSDLKATQAKVIQQEKMASIGQLAAGVAHEINNPMGFILSNLNTLGKYVSRLDDFIKAQSDLIGSIPDEVAVSAVRAKRKDLKVDYILEDTRELLKESLEGAERVRTIVQNLKTFSRVDEAEAKPTDINECITSTINIVWNELKYKTNLTKELGDVPLTRCRPQQINQVIMNLLVNAAQAIEKQGEITVRTWHDDSSVFLSVSDNGCGIPPEILNRIFEPFFTTKEVGKGTGLGLSITYDIIKSHNGEISVESRPGEGTNFTVRLPILK
jgi:two-component system NtrC family sensor kinase